MNSGNGKFVSAGRCPSALGQSHEFSDALNRLERVDAILAASAHHRLVWIHPFLDGNGHVAWLMIRAMLLESLETGGLCSVSRGFARVEVRCKGILAVYDPARRNDLEGRGALSEEDLAKFTRFFLNTCLDQVRFMHSLVEPGGLRVRIMRWD